PHRWPQYRELPIHPPLDVAALRGVLRMQLVAAARRAEIAQDRIGLPDDGLAVLDRRNEAVRVDREIRGIPNATGVQAGSDALERDVHLRAALLPLLDVRGRDPAPDLEHGVPPARALSGAAIRC